MRVQHDIAAPAAGLARRGARRPGFHGWRVVGGAFTVAVFGWGLGFYGPPIYLHAGQAARGWPLALIASAVTAHFLVGAVTVANLPALYRRCGVAKVTSAGALALAAGVFGWAVAASPWQLFAATMFSGAGWAATGAAAVHALRSPRVRRPAPGPLPPAHTRAS